MKKRSIILALILGGVCPGLLSAQAPVINAVDKNGAIDDGKPLDPSPDLKIELTGFGCVSGFGGWTEPAKPPDEEKDCDQKNLQDFKKVFRKCAGERRAQFVPMFDIDRDGCATCEDYFAWKIRIKDLFLKEKRSTDGQDLVFEACDKPSK